MDFNNDIVNAKEELNTRAYFFGSGDDVYNTKLTNELISAIIREEKDLIIKLIFKGAYIFDSVADISYEVDGDNKISETYEQYLKPITTAVISAEPDIFELLIKESIRKDNHYLSSCTIWNKFDGGKCNDTDKDRIELMEDLVSYERLDLFPILAKFNFFNESIVDKAFECCFKKNKQHLLQKLLNIPAFNECFKTHTKGLWNKIEALYNMGKTYSVGNEKLSSSQEKIIKNINQFLLINEVEENIKANQDIYVKKLISLNTKNVTCSIELALYFVKTLGFDLNKPYIFTQNGNEIEKTLWSKLAFSDEKKAIFQTALLNMEINELEDRNKKLII